MYLNFHPEFELFADRNMAEAVSMIPWDLREAYYCVNVQQLPLSAIGDSSMYHQS